MNKKTVQDALNDALRGLKDDPQLCRQVLNRARRQGTNSKRRLTAGMIAAIALLMMTMGTALAAASGWNVLQFLFPSSADTTQVEVTPVGKAIQSEGAVLRVDSALYDGRTLAFDWYIENKKPEIPMYCRVEAFTANGVRVWTDGSDSFDETWMPGYFWDASCQDGEIILLPEELIGAETLHVDMTVALYRPARPIYQMDTFDPNAAARKIEEGFYVIAEGDGWVIWDEDSQNYFHGFGGEPTRAMGAYDTEQLRVAFDLALPRDGILPLKTEESYENASCAASYDAAEITSLGLYLKLRVKPKEDFYLRSGSWKLTDAAGHPLFALVQDSALFAFNGELSGRSGQQDRIADYQWYGLKADDLPDVISLTWLPEEEGDMMLFPVYVR